MEINKIYNEDCITTMQRMPDEFIDLTVTSPPYDNLRNYNGCSFDFERIAKELYRVTKAGGVVVWVVGDATINGSETLTSFKQAIYFVEQCGLRLHDTMIYHKQNVLPQNSLRYEQHFEYMFVFSKGKPNTFNAITEKAIKPNPTKIKDYTGHRIADGTFSPFGTQRKEYKRLGNVWSYAIGLGGTTGDKIAFEHPAMFHEKLVADHIHTWSNEGDLIYDPFGGSGTTAKMAHIANRNWILSEISDEYVQIANKRIEPYLKQISLYGIHTKH